VLNGVDCQILSRQRRFRGIYGRQKDMGYSELTGKHYHGEYAAGMSEAPVESKLTQE
jgi:hypothetical protein